MSELSFSAARAEDVPALADVLSSATRHKIEHEDTVWGAEDWTEEEVHEALAESTMYSVRKGDEVVGTVSLQWDDERNWGLQPPVAGYIHRLAVKEGFHGQGIGERIVDWAATRAAENGRSVLRLDCEDTNTNLCRYYEKLGFVRVGTRDVSDYKGYRAALYERRVLPL